MDPSQIDGLVQRLVSNPHDEQALGDAHQAGTSDPKSYALFLERVGSQTQDPAVASHWLSEAANVWSTTLGDAHRAARVLMQAIDRDPTQRTAAERLAQLYRDKGDVKALVALLERRAKALGPLASDSPEITAELTGMHEELGRLWSESLAQPRKALDNFRRAAELDPTNSHAIYGAREIHKSLGQWAEALDLYDAELRIERDPARQVALLRDEAATRRTAGDLSGASRALARARQIDAHDPALQQEFATTIVERLAAGESPPAQERTLGAELLVGLAETYDGEHGLAYSAGALDIEPGHDRALQLYAYYARALAREDDVANRYLAYIGANPSGAMAGEARWLLAASYEAAAQLEAAVQLLEPLRAAGDAQATTKLRELYARLGLPMPPVAPPPPASLTHPTVARGASPRPAATALETAQQLAASGSRDEAYVKYREVLEGNPAHAEALAWTEDYLRTKRDYRALRDVLLAAIRVPNEPIESRKERLREVAALSEGNLRDPDGAIDAWKQLLTIDRSDEVGRQSLTRLLDRAQRWDDLAVLLEHEATLEGDLEKRIALEKRLANLHEHKRHDFAGAGEAWERITNLIPDDDQAVTTAAELYEKAGALDRAAQVIAATVGSVTDPTAHDGLLERLGGVRERMNDMAGAGEAYAEAADRQRSGALWESAERCFAAASNWARAGQAADRRGALEATPHLQARHLSRSAEHFARAGDEAAVIAQLERSLDLDPNSENVAQILIDRYTASRRWAEIVSLHMRRSDRLADPPRRIAARRQAARLLATEIRDKGAAREAWRKVNQDGEDREALEYLIEDAVEREDYEDATAMLRRLEAAAIERADKARIALREAELVADGLGDVSTAIARYERVLSMLDPESRLALQAIADLQEARDNPAAAAAALERELVLVGDPADRGPIAERLARLYEQLGDLEPAIRALDVLHNADPDDFDALSRLCELCEKTKKWDRVAELLAQRIEVEADEGEMSLLTRRLSRVLVDELNRGDEALAVLVELADRGDEALRAAYVELGDRLGWRGIVAAKLVEWWWDAKPSADRNARLRGAFDRFAEVGRDEDALRVGCEIARGKGGDGPLARRLEQIALKTQDLDALSVAHDLMARETMGAERAHELVRQAEVRVRAGASRAEALRHGEQGLTSVPPGQAEELLQRLATIAEEPNEVVDLYERQIGRCKATSDRVTALGRAAQVAAAYGQLERARGLFDLALSGTPSDEVVMALEDAAREADTNLGDDRMRRAIASAFANGGQGARDGGRTRGALLLRAATLAFRELHDTDQAFAWLSDALVAHVDATSLDAVEALAREVGEPRRADAALSRALGEVFDGPLVRQLLTRRASLRRQELDDKAGAAADLRRLYELAPSDQSVLDELTSLLTDLGDYRGMVQVCEDQILRGKDIQARAELARKVARLWEDRLADPREAADAWRRVLRMKHGDAEAQAGLDRAKANMLRRPSGPPDPEGGESGNPPPGAGPAAGPVPEDPADNVSPASFPPVARAEGGATQDSGRPPQVEAGPSGLPVPAAQAQSEGDTETRRLAAAKPSTSAGAEPETTALEPASPVESVESNESPQALARALADDLPVTVGEPESDDDAPDAGDQTSVVAMAVPAEARRPLDEVLEAGGDDVIIADDLAEMLDVDEEIVPADPEKLAEAEPEPMKKRTVPPPLPRP